MNGISSMLDALLRPDPLPTPYPSKVGKSATLRRILRDGPATARELAQRSGISPKNIRAHLKRDIEQNRVRLIGSLYRLAPDYDEHDTRRIIGAIRLLQQRGYTITKPGTRLAPPEASR